MDASRRIRRVVVPLLWLLIGGTIAVSLAVLAFGGGDDAEKDVLTPSATNQSETVDVELGTIDNTLTVPATITLDAAVKAKAPDAGKLSFVYVANGGRIEEGAPLYQLTVQAEAAETSGDGAGAEGEDSDEAPARPAVRYVTVRAPATGRVSGLSAALGDDVEDGATVASIKKGTFTARGSVSPLDRYRLLDLPDDATVTVRGGPEPFTCDRLRVADAATAEATTNADGTDAAAEGDAGEGGGGSPITCRVPRNVTVFDGLSAELAVEAGSAEKVLVVPVTAVRGLVEKGAVWVVGQGGEPTRREVDLGVSDGVDVEVVKGLAEGDQVLRYVPGTSPEDTPENPEAF